MATKRFGYLDDLSLKNQKVGIGTSTANEKLEVVGGTRGGGVVVTGIATLTSYEGFQNKNTSYTENVNIAGGESGTLSGEIVVGSGLTMSVGTAATSGQGSIECMKVYDTFNPPCGGTNGRPAAAKPGTIYYNKDFKTIEYWDGNFWRQVDNTTRSGRGVIAGGYIAPLRQNTIDYIQISTLGNAADFGDLATTTAQPGPSASSIRGLFSGGMTPSTVNKIEYITIGSGGNGIDFGDLTRTTNSPGALSSSTRSITAGGTTPSASDVIDYVEISTLGNAIDFGNLMGNLAGNGGLSSPVRGVFGGGYAPDRTRIQYITIASKGDATNFGELTQHRGGPGSGGNSIRGIFCGGDGGGHHNTIDYITIASTGNAIDFGDAQQTFTEIMGSCSSSVRVTFNGGNNPGQNPMDDIDYVEIASTGNSMDFGNLSLARRGPSSLSDSHGGLGGF